MIPTNAEVEFALVALILIDHAKGWRAGIRLPIFKPASCIIAPVSSFRNQGSKKNPLAKTAKRVLIAVGLPESFFTELL